MSSASFNPQGATANDYVWVFTCRDSLIAAVRNFTDTKLADSVFGLENKTPTVA